MLKSGISLGRMHHSCYMFSQIFILRRYTVHVVSRIHSSCCMFLKVQYFFMKDVQFMLYALSYVFLHERFTVHAVCLKSGVPSWRVHSLCCIKDTQFIVYEGCTFHFVCLVRYSFMGDAHFMLHFKIRLSLHGGCTVHVVCLKTGIPSWRMHSSFWINEAQFMLYVSNQVFLLG